jgi:hypothetical protein
MASMNRFSAGIGVMFALSAAPASAQGVVNVYCSVQVEWCTLAANEFQRASENRVLKRLGLPITTTADLTMMQFDGTRENEQAFPT